ncbi:MAG: F0F1 ATP synthase subunit A [Pseudomonadota bacterium]
MANDPIKQFKVEKLVELTLPGTAVDISFTNVALFMALSAISATALLTLSMQGRALVPGRVQSVAELLYEFVANSIVRPSLGSDGQRFFPFVFTLFLFILFGNMLGMVPYFFTFTSQIIVTFALAMLVISIVLIYGFMKNGLGFLKLFVPSGVPAAVLWLVVIIEVFSFISRPVSLGVRLFANMLAGHITLKVFSGFISTMAGAGALGVIGAILPLGMTVAITALEFLVAFLQAYVFAILTCIYLNDAVHPGH